MEDNFEFKKKSKYILFGLMGIGLLVSIVSIFVFKYDGTRIWANVLLNNLFFLAMPLSAGFFLAVSRISLAGWHTAIQRVPEAMTSFLPVSAILMFLMFFGMKDLYEWTHTDHLDEVIQHKSVYLNIPFFFIRMLIYFAGWIAITHFMNKNTKLLHETRDLKYHNKRKVFAGLFMVFFALTLLSSNWDWIMSIDVHWYSTLFSWYVFSGIFVTGLACLILLIWFLKRLGHLEYVNQDHLHDLGKYLFGFSIFWAYLWFSQYLLIWYAHIPEETVYFIQRKELMPVLFFLNLILGFGVPFFALMTVKAKRNINWLASVALIVLVGHWLDYFQMIMPGTVGEELSIGPIEIGMTVFYFGLFLFVVLRSLSKSPLISENEPYHKESLNFES